MPSRSTSSKSKSGRRKYHSDPTNNRTRKNSYSTGLKMNAAFHKLSAEQKDYNVYMQTMTFLCHKVKIGTKEAILSPSQEEGLHKIASHLEQKFKEENMDFNVNAFKSLFRRTAHSLHQGGMLKSKLAGGNPKSDSSDSEDEAQMVVYQNIPVGARNQSAVYRWFSNAVSLRMNQEKLDILALLALFLGIFELLCAWASLSSLASTLTGSNAAEVTSGFSSFIVNEINSSGFFELFTFGFIGNGFNRIFSNQLDFLQSSLISQIGAVSTTLSDSIQNTCFSHLAEQGIWSKMADAFVPGNLDIQLQCIGEVTKIEGNRAVANISADFQLVMTRFRTDSQRVLNQAWSGVWYIRGAIGWFSYRLGYQGLAMSMFNMGETMKTYRPTRRIRVARPGEVEGIRPNSSLRRREIVDNVNEAGGGGGRVSERAVVEYLNQPRRKESNSSTKSDNDVAF
jgi:hypothetical protein